ncbi:hypothetical protein BGZ92_006804, partial [Podila epicladia]
PSHPLPHPNTHPLHSTPSYYPKEGQKSDRILYPQKHHPSFQHPASQTSIQDYTQSRHPQGHLDQGLQYQARQQLQQTHPHAPSGIYPQSQQQQSQHQIYTAPGYQQQQVLLYQGHPPVQYHISHPQIQHTLQQQQQQQLKQLHKQHQQQQQQIQQQQQQIQQQQQQQQQQLQLFPSQAQSLYHSQPGQRQALPQEAYDQASLDNYGQL